MDQIKFFQLNICGLSDRSITCLEKYAYDFDADFIFLSETKVGADVPFKNYDHVYKFNKHKSSQGGVGLLVKKCFKSDKQCVLE